MFTKLYKPRNIFSTIVHYGATGLVMAGSVMIGQPWAIATAAALTGGISYLSLAVQKNFLENNLVRHPDVHKFSPRLGKTMEELYKVSGLKSEGNPVYDFRADDEKIGKKPRLRDQLMKALFDAMAKTNNAAALNISKPVIMISEPLLKLLDDAEEKAVLAHEFTHAAARHQHLSIPQHLLAGVAGMTSFLTKATAMVNVGWNVIGYSVLGMFGVNKLFKKLPNGELLGRKDDSLNFRELKTKKKLEKIKTKVNTLLADGIIVAVSPVYLKILAVTTGISTASSLVTSAFSRSMEYQADRGAVEMGANPLALVTALRKMTLVQKTSMEREYGGPLPEPGVLSKAWTAATSTHPTLNRRIGRLCAIAKKHGYSADEIEKASKGQITVEPGNDIPHDTILSMMHIM